ncbi:ABC transporter permease [candidate division KSB1 bacterium]
MISGKMIAVIKREYITRVRTKGFIIGTLLLPFVFVLLIGGIFIFSILFQPSTKDYYVVDHSGRIYDQFTAMLDDTLSSGQPKYRFTEHNVPPRELDSRISEFQELVIGKEIDGYLIIPENIVEEREVRYSARSVSNFEEQIELARVLSQIVTNIRLERKGLSPDEIRREMAMGSVSLVSRQVTTEGEIIKSSFASFGLNYVLTYLLLFGIIMYGIMVMRSVIEEKSQRITETIVSSIRPVELMIGKIIGICSLGLTQLAVVGLLFIMAVAYGETLFVKFGVTTPGILDIIRQIQFPPVLLMFLLIFYFMGFIFYAGLFAAVGAVVNTEDEGQQFQLPIHLILVMGYIMMLTVAQNPDTTMAFWISLVPFFTPIVMYARIVVSDPVMPSGAYLSLFTMAASTVLLMMLVAKIYRIGILMYGKKPSVKEIIKWIRYR